MTSPISDTSFKSKLMRTFSSKGGFFAKHSFHNRRERCDVFSEQKFPSVTSKDSIILKLQKDNQNLRDENFQLRRRLRDPTDPENQRINLLVADRVLQQITHITAKHQRYVDLIEKMTTDFKKTEDELKAVKRYYAATGALRTTRASEVVNQKLLHRFTMELPDIEEEPVFDFLSKEPSFQSFSSTEENETDHLDQCRICGRAYSEESDKMGRKFKDDENCFSTHRRNNSNIDFESNMTGSSLNSIDVLESITPQLPVGSESTDRRRKEVTLTPKQIRPKRKAAPGTLKEKSLKGKMRRN